MLTTLIVDFEEYNYVAAFTSATQRREWDQYESQVEWNGNHFIGITERWRLFGGGVRPVGSGITPEETPPSPPFHTLG